MANPKCASVVVMDPEPVARCGLVHLLGSHAGLRVVGEAESVPVARELCAKLKPEVLVLDVGCGDGFALLRELPRWSAGTRVVVLSAVADAMSVQRAFKAGVCGYVARRDPVAALMGAILGAVAGERHMGPGVESVVLTGMACGEVAVTGRPEAGLSERELEIFQLIGRGLGTKAVAVELRVSVKTVETHRQRIKVKLGYRDGIELQRQAVLCHLGDGRGRG